MLTQLIAAVPAKELRTPVLSLDAHSDDIMRALDMLLPTGVIPGGVACGPGDRRRLHRG